MLKPILLVTIKLILTLLIFIVLMSLFVLITESELFDEKSFGIKFAIAFPFALVCGIFSVIILFNFEPTALAVSQTEKTKTINLVKCQVREFD